MEQLSRRLPPLSALQPFEATARLGSLSAAADELSRTHSAVSKQIHHLSADLGGDLFSKHGTGLKLTERGERLAQVLGPLLDQLDAVSTVLRAEIDDRNVRLAVSATLATRWLMPRLPRFYAEFPGIEVGLLMSGPGQVARHEADVFLSYDRLRGDVQSADQLSVGDCAYGLVCAPDYPIKHDAETVQVGNLLTQPGAHQVWTAYQELIGRRILAPRQQDYPHHLLALEAAAAGLGVGLAEARLVAEDLASQKLTAPFGFKEVSGGLRAVILPRGRKKTSVRSLLSWLRTEAIQIQAD